MRIDATANHISDSVNTLRSTRGSRARASQAWVRQKLEQRHVVAALVG
jgi:hypothetical protein